MHGKHHVQVWALPGNSLLLAGGWRKLLETRVRSVRHRTGVVRGRGRRSASHLALGIEQYIVHAPA